MIAMSWRVAIVLGAILPVAVGCAGVYGHGGGYGYAGDDLGVDYYEPYGGYYGGWGGGYRVGPYRGGDHRGGHGFPSIPSGGHEGGGGHGRGGGGGHR
jgi:hypothetical protein